MNYIFIKEKPGIIVKLILNDIFFIKANKDYCEIHIKDKRYVIHSTLGNIEELLPSNFYKCQRSYIVNLDKIISVNDNDVITLEDNREISFSSNNKNELLDKLNYIKWNQIQKQKI